MFGFTLLFGSLVLMILIGLMNGDVLFVLRNSIALSFGVGLVIAGYYGEKIIGGGKS